MKYIRLKTHDPYYNLAVEEYLFRNADEDIFMLWQNSPSVIVGRNQNVYAEVDLGYTEREGICVCRRITGGGAVYHDLGNINYTFISVKGDARALDFEYFTRPIIRALKELGVEASLGGRNDIECGGRKISGNAQHIEGGRVLHHGTLLFSTDFGVMESALKVDKEKLSYRAVKSTRARVINMREALGREISAEEFLSELERYVSSELGAIPTEAPRGVEIDAIYRRNRSSEWIFSEKRYLTEYAVTRKKKYPFGLVSVELEFEREVISDIVISGDFFGVRPIEELESSLIGKRYGDSLALDLTPYICGMRDEELLELIWKQ